MKLSSLTLASLMAVIGGSAYAVGPTLVNTNITTDTQWTTADSPYVLEGLIYVKNGATLDIAPGVVVRGQPLSTASSGDPGTLIVTRDGKIQARGTAANPIIFTTAILDAGLMASGPRNGLRYDSADAGTVPDRWTAAEGDTKWLDLTPAATPLTPVNSALERNSGLWGGLIILGNASTNASYDVTLPADAIPEQGYSFIEGLNSSTDLIYGGTNDLDSSGTIKYVSLRHGGFTLSNGKEVNGLTLGGVGRGTTIDHIDIYCNADDGVEIFGGTVDVNYINVFGAEDDGLDTDQGYRGTTQFVNIVHGMTVNGVSLVSSSDPRGMELDGDDANETGTPITTGGLPRQEHRIYNVTVQTNGQIGVVFRRGFGGILANSIIHTSATQATGIDFNTSAGTGSINVQQRFADSELQLRNVTVNGFTAANTTFTATPTGGSFTSFDPVANTGLATDVFYPVTNNRTTTADMLNISYAANGLNPRPGAGPGSPNAGATGSTQDSAYVPVPVISTTYKGAFLGSATTLWTTGWTAINKANTDGIKLLVD